MMAVIPAAAYAHSLNIWDYNTTTSEGRITSANLSYNGYTTYAPNGKSLSFDYANSEELRHECFYDSLDRTTRFELDAEHNAGAMSPSDTITHDYIWGDYSSDIYYQPEKDLFIGGECSYSIQRLDTVSSPVYYEDISHLRLNVGIGRQISLYPIADAGAIEDRLMEAGFLKGPLPKDVMLKMAEIINKNGQYYDNNPDTGQGKFLKDLSDVISASGQLTRPLGGFAFWRVNQFRYVNYSRTKGEKFEVFLDSQHELLSSTPSTLPPGHRANMDDSNSLLFGGEYDRYMPIDWRSQLDIALSSAVSLSYDPAGYSTVDPRNKHMVEVSYSYDLTNRLWYSLSFHYERNNYRDLPDSNYSDYSSIKNYYFDINYLVEDWTSIGISYSSSLRDTNETFDVTQIYTTIIL